MLANKTGAIYAEIRQAQPSPHDDGGTEGVCLPPMTMGGPRGFAFPP